jgi:hypothetical protein
MSTDIIVEKFARYFRDPVLGEAALRVGASGIACRNIRRAIGMLSSWHSLSDNSVFDSDLEQAVIRFQEENRHRVIDGSVGPGTRRLLATMLLARFGPEIYRRLTDPEAHLFPRVFITYAWKDSEAVKKLDQWLRDHAVTVLRDETWFLAGTTIPDSIRTAIILADKVVAIYSEKSRDRDWTRVEIAIAEQVEERLGYPVLIYVNLDETVLPKHDPNRIAISAKNRSLRDVGNELLRAIRNEQTEPSHYSYNEDEPLS